MTRPPPGRRRSGTPIADMACDVIGNQRKVVARPMAVINLITRARLTRAAVVGVIAVAGVLAGCGTAAPGAGGSAGSHANPAKASLTIKVADEANGRVNHWTLRCDPPGGTTPHPAAACRALFGTKDAFAPRRHLVMCPMIMVSAKQIIVDGIWFGKKVHRVIIDGGCDLAMFNSLAKTFN